MKRIEIKILVFMIWMLIGLAGMGWAATEVPEQEPGYGGKFIFNPSMETSFRHDDNYYLEAVQEVSVNTWVVQPGFESGYTTATSSIFLNYYLSKNEYSGDARVQNDDYYGHDLAFSAQTQATNHFLVGLDETYAKKRVTGDLDDVGAQVNREKYDLNKFSPFVAYDFNETWGMDFRYSNEIMDYAQNLNEDSEIHRGEVDLNYSFAPTSVMSLEYNVWHQDYKAGTPNYLSQQATLAYEKEYELFFIRGGVGYHDRRFDNAGQYDFNDVVWTLSVNGESSSGRYSFGLDRNFNNFGPGQQYYKGLSVTAMVGYLFVDRLDVALTGKYQQRRYINDPKDEDLWQVSGEVTYDFTENLSAAVLCGYETRSSNQVLRDYDNRYIMISAKVKFEVFADPSAK